MKRLLLLCSLLLLMTITTRAQLTENFTDGDFTNNPVWTGGGTTDFIVNTALQLQSNNTTANSTFFLSTVSTLATAAEWNFYVTLDFATSSANYTDIFLTASSSDLTAVSTTGYFVRIGNTADEISLYRKDGNTSIKIIDGTDGSVNSSSNSIKIKVTRDAANKWSLYRDLVGGNNFINEGTATDNTYTTCSYFGFLIKQSTASFFQKHFFDDIEIKTFVPDVVPPLIISATAISSRAIDVLFDEPLEAASSQSASNYTVNNNIGLAASAVLDAGNPALVHLTFSTDFPNVVTNTLTINGLQDLAGNMLNNGTTSFSFYMPQRYDIVIDEIMADPTPVVGLPAYEWIELRNTSAFPIHLYNWKIADAAGMSGPMPNFILQPDSFLIVCTGNAVASMLAFGTAIPVTSFPSLNNAGEFLSLVSDQGAFIHSVNYKVGWFQNESKKEGGWSLEMIDPKNPCSGFSNWRASMDAKGGTPGKKNSVDGFNPDQSAPQLLRAYTTDSVNIILVFDEPLDISKAAIVSNYSIREGIIIDSVSAISPGFDRVNLKLISPLQRNKIYTVTVNGITDCSGNLISSKKIAKVGIGEMADSLDVVINEILFNPPPNGTDYIEIYNRGNKIIDLEQTYIANRNAAGAISNIKSLSTDSYLLFPQDFMVITEDPSIVKAAYITQNPAAFITVASMPSYNDDEGDVILLNTQGVIMDELKYNEKWHFKLINNREGVALERIDYNAATQLQDNWHSAASSSGYGTPTYKNSQYRVNDDVKGEINLSPEIISPDNDGQDDFATIEYTFPEPGYVANITIFNASGRPVRYLQRNSLCGTRGNFRWDGIGESNQQLATGIYILLMEVFNLSGKKKQFKKAIVIARRN